VVKEKSMTATTAGSRQQVRIFYRAWSHDRPMGGQKQMYRHVDILNSAGFDAYVFHDVDGFRLTWFRNDTRVIGPTEFTVLRRPRDILVLSEDVGEDYFKYSSPKVIFNQNIYHGYKLLGTLPPERYPYEDNELLGVMAVSEHNATSLAYAFPNARILRVLYGIDLEQYKPVALPDKSPLIATIMKGGSAPELQALVHTLCARARQGIGPLRGFDISYIDNISETAVAELLRQAVAFVFLSGMEGFGLLPLEAMAAGCIVSTFDVDPLREFIPNDCRFQPGDFVSSPAE